VSVYNGETWQNYEVVGGLSKPDTLSGPLGERLFHIAVCPATAPGTFKDPLTEKESRVADSVWMCTSAGLALYFPSTDTWSYLTRAEGLPSDQANALAFASDGTVFVATQCDGIAIAGPQDGYKTWKQAARRRNDSQDGPLTDELPVTATGTCLPCNLMNDILVAKDGTVYAATTAGIAWSEDQGQSWRYVRGKDYGDKVRGRVEGPPTGWVEQAGALLSEDYCTSLAIDSTGNLHLGHRSAATDILQPQVAGLVANVPADYARCVLTLPTGTNGLLGSYMGGLQSENPAIAWEASTATPLRKLPKTAAPLSETELSRLALAGTQTFSTGEAALVFLGADWATQGDWVGRYGRKMTILCAAGSPDDHEVGYGLPTYRVVPSVMKKTIPDEQVRNWCWAIQSDERRVLWDPTVALRRPAGWDEHGEGFSRALNGIGVNVAVTMPEGVHRIALYFMNFSGHGRDQRNRDYLVTVAREGNTERPTVRTRVQDFHQGVYQQFLTRKGGTYVFSIDRNYSYNVMLSGVLVDKLKGPTDVADSMALPWMGNLPYEPFKVKWESSSLAEVRAVLECLKDANAGVLNWHRIALVESARYLQAARPQDPLMEQVKWASALWSREDRARFDETMLDAWRAMQAINPDLKLREWRPHSPGTE
jgi:hypothetical protein